MRTWRMSMRIAAVAAVALSSLASCAMNGVEARDSNHVLRGVTLAGAEFGVSPDRNWPGVHGTDYVYPHTVPAYEGVLAYYATRGVDVIRLPFRWERLQPELFGALDSTELDLMNGFVGAARARGMRVILDPHNYGRYCETVSYRSDSCGDERLIGKPAVPFSAFADLWRRLAAEFQDHPGVYAYALMNEPTYLAEADFPLWPRAAQAAVDAIRAAGDERLIMVPGNGWSGAHAWDQYNRDLWIGDPANNILYEAHQYFDADNSGTYQQSYEVSGAYPDVGVERVKPFVDWLKARGARGFIGEYGVPGDDPRWLTVMERFLVYLDENCVGAAYWAGGPWWPSDYVSLIEPLPGLQDRPQMEVLQDHPSFECTD